MDISELRRRAQPWWQRTIGFRLAVIALALDGGAVATAGEPIAAPPIGEADSLPAQRQSFAAWADAVAARRGASATGLAEIELDGDPGIERIARVCLEGAREAVVLIEDAAARWVVERDGARDDAACRADAVAHAWDDDSTELVLMDRDGDAIHERTIGLRDGVLVVVGERGPAEGFEARWDLGSFHAGDDARAYEGHVVSIVEPGASRLQPSVPYVLAGRNAWTGPDDAELALAAERRPDGALLLRIALRDDDPHPYPSGDRVEVWWAMPDEPTPRGIEVHATPRGLDTRWLAGSGDKPPVHGAVHGFEVMLPVPVIDGALPLAHPLTIRAIDVDDGGRTTLATSRFDGTIASMGMLRRVPGGAVLEETGRRVPDASHLDALPRPPLLAASQRGQ